MSIIRIPRWRWVALGVLVWGCVLAGVAHSRLAAARATPTFEKVIGARYVSPDRKWGWQEYTSGGLSGYSILAVNSPLQYVRPFDGPFWTMHGFFAHELNQFEQRDMPSLASFAIDRQAERWPSYSCGSICVLALPWPLEWIVGIDCDAYDVNANAILLNGVWESTDRSTIEGLVNPLVLINDVAPKWHIAPWRLARDVAVAVAGIVCTSVAMEWIAGKAVARFRRRRGLCEGCGYPNGGGRCPECGVGKIAAG